MFADAIEASAKNRPVRIPVAAKEITEEADFNSDNPKLGEGYFTIALKPLTVRGETVSNTVKKEANACQ